MADIRAIRLAKLVANFCLEVKKDNWISISGDFGVSSELIHEIYREVIKAGGNPFLVPAGSDLQEIYYKEASEDQLKWISPILEQYQDKLDGMINIHGTTNTTALNSIDPTRQQIRAKAVGKSIMPKLMKRQAEGKLKGLVTLFPCPALAQDAEMSLSEYEDFVYEAMFCDEEDPEAEWIKLGKKQKILVDWLNGREKVEIHGEHVDLTLSIKGRTFVSADGKSNMPDGEIFTGPVEDSAEGHVEFTYPAVKNGRVVENVQLDFEKGKVVKATAEKNQDFLKAMIATDDGSSYLGELGIGTNFGIQRFTKEILFDEKIGGTFHLAVGAGYPETGSKNKSGIHWDMICALGKDGEISVDGEPLFKNGNFVLWEKESK